MKVKCAWHQKNFGFELDMGVKPPFGGPRGKFDKQVTHGICKECSEKELPNRKQLDDLNAMKEASRW